MPAQRIDGDKASLELLPNGILHLEWDKHCTVTTADAEAAMGAGGPAVGLTEPVEHVGQFVSCDAAPGIGDVEHGLARLEPQPNLHPPAVRGEPHRVRQQVRHHAPEALRIALHRCG